MGIIPSSLAPHGRSAFSQMSFLLGNTDYGAAVSLRPTCLLSLGNINVAQFGQVRRVADSVAGVATLA